MIHTSTEEPPASTGTELATQGDRQEITIHTILQQGEFPLFAVQERGMTISEELGEDIWTELVKVGLDAFSATKEAHVRVMFRLGDLLSFGEAKFGERYAQAIDATKNHLRLETKTLENIEWIARKVPAANRHENLSLSHHEAVCKLEPKEQAKFLNKAEKEAWSVSQLKGEVKEAHPGKKKIPKASTRTPATGDTAPTEEEAKEGAEKVLLYFEDQEKPENKGKLSTWPKTDVVRWAKILHEHEMLGKRLRNAAKKATA